MLTAPSDIGPGTPEGTPRRTAIHDVFGARGVTGLVQTA